MMTREMLLLCVSGIGRVMGGVCVTTITRPQDANQLFYMLDFLDLQLLITKSC